MLLVVYKSQLKAYMIAALSSEWFDQIFILGVEIYQKEVGKDENTLFIADNVPSHSSLNLLEKETVCLKHSSYHQI